MVWILRCSCYRTYFERIVTLQFAQNKVSSFLILSTWFLCFMMPTTEHCDTEMLFEFSLQAFQQFYSLTFCCCCCWRELLYHVHVTPLFKLTKTKWEWLSEEFRCVCPPPCVPIPSVQDYFTHVRRFCFGFDLLVVYLSAEHIFLVRFQFVWAVHTVAYDSDSLSLPLSLSALSGCTVIRIVGIHTSLFEAMSHRPFTGDN